MRWRRLPVYVFLSFAALLVAGAVALWLGRPDSGDASLLVEIAHRRDRADAGFEEVRHKEFDQVGSHYSGGYDRAAHWFRLRVRPPVKGGPVLLTVYPNFLDNVALYSIDAEGRWHIRRSGDGIGSEERDWKGPGIGFEIDPRQDGSLYYLRVRTESTVEVFLSALPMENALIHATKQMAVHAVVFAMLALATVLALLQLFYRPSGTNLLLVLCSFGYLLYSVFMLGYPALAHPEWSGAVLARITDLLYLTVALVTLLFHRQFLAPLRPIDETIMATDFLSAACLANFCLYAAGYEQLAFAVASVVVLLTAPTLVVMAWTVRENGHPSLVYVRLFYSVFGAFVALVMMSNLGLFQAVWLNRYNVEICGLMNVLLVLALVLSRWWSSERRIAASKARLRDVALRQEVRARSAKLQDSLLHMLVHEVRNHLSVIELSVQQVFDDADRARAKGIVRDLERLIQDCQRFSRLERGVWEPKPQATDLVSTVLETLADLGDEDRFDVAYEAMPVVMVDAGMLRIALGALVSEAGRLVGSGGLVRVAVDGDRTKGWSVTVSGESEKRLPAPLSLSHADRSMGTRSSLSLAITKGIVELIGGRLGIDYRGDGFRCDITLRTASASLSSRTMPTSTG